LQHAVRHHHDRSLDSEEGAMSYLLQHTRRPHSKGAHLDEKLRLNGPGFDGGAYVHVFVGITRRRRVPRFVLEIADCANTINLEFSVDTPELRDNSLYKIDTLIGALQRFRGALNDIEGGTR
jgi:hypothetical protein